ncbi:MAG TPA: DinB family protein [Thermoanaerobaculaceae bacterium]|nr:DinB family protein [Thermoanaerobaculaceae bacterium]HRS17592.1 DinB family protein [Thermoanaerobaculaceae bacterium]
MADLLECLLQLKALAQTPERLAELASRAESGRWRQRPVPGERAPLEVLAHMAEAELAYSTQLRLVLGADRPLLPPFEPAAPTARADGVSGSVETVLESFTARRRDNLELLERCNASDLARTGRHPVRGEVTVADLVALLLAHDIDHLGELRQGLGLAEPLPDRSPSHAGETGFPTGSCRAQGALPSPAAEPRRREGGPEPRPARRPRGTARTARRR